MEQISIKDKLPEDCQDVLIGGPNRPWLAAVYWDEEVGTKAGFYVERSDSTFELIDWVTHWVAFPEPLK